MKEASSKEKEYHYHYIKNIRNLLNKNDNLKTAIVLNFNRKVKVLDLIKMYWSKITNQSIKSAIYHNEIESKKRWLRYISKDYSDRNQNLLVYY